MYVWLDSMEGYLVHKNPEPLIPEIPQIQAFVFDCCSRYKCTCVFTYVSQKFSSGTGGRRKHTGTRLPRFHLQTAVKFENGGKRCVNIRDESVM